MRSIISKVLFVILVLLTIFLFPSRGNLPTTRAAAATYKVMAGMNTGYIADVMAFGPQTLKVHRGDTVTWVFNGAHNVHFASKPTPLVINSQIDGKSVSELNPAVVLPTIEDGGKYVAGANSGIPQDKNTFSVVMDAAVGTYTYVCDLHPGMIGFIEVVDDNVNIPSPEEAEKAGQAELATALAQSDVALLKFAKLPGENSGKSIQVLAGASEGVVGFMAFFPSAVSIVEGQSVTWVMPKLSEPHTINIPLASLSITDVVPFSPMMDSAQKPHLVLSEATRGNVKSGDELPANGQAKSGILMPGDSFTLKFPKAGVYTYYCAFHPEMTGVVFVQPQDAAQGMSH